MNGLSASERAQLDGLVAALDRPAELARRAGGIDDWEAFLRAAGEQGVAGLLFDAFAGAGVEPPAEVREDLALALARERLWCRKLGADLALLARSFERAGVPMVVLKGIVLAERLYPRPDLRPGGDLDLLVDPGDLDRAVEILLDLGYHRPPGEPAVPAPDADGVPHAFAFEAWDRAPVELHREASSGLATRLAAGPLVRRSIPYLTAGGLELRILEPVDEALYLAVHGVRHRFCRLRWLYEVAISLRRLEPRQRRALGARARETGLSRALALARLLVERRLGLRDAGMPGTQVADARLRLAARAALYPVMLEIHPSGSLSRLSRLLAFSWYRLLLAERLGQGLRHAVRQLAAAARRAWGRRRDGN